MQITIKKIALALCVIVPCLAIAQNKEYPKPAAMTPQMTEFWTPQPQIVTPAPYETVQPAPSDAIVLLGPTGDLSQWKHDDGSAVKWSIANGVMTVKPQTGQISTKQKFGDCQLHIEWSAPTEIKGESQGRGNSGVFMQGLYEVQILDNYQNETYMNGQAGSIYKQTPPLVNPIRKPGQWNTYDIIYTAPRFKEDGTLHTHGRITVLFNGVLVQNNTLILGTTEYIGMPRITPHGDGPIILQDHGDKVRFRNIWIRELNASNKETLKAIIITGQNNHVWEVSHAAIKQILENSGLFTVDIAMSPKEGKDMSEFLIDFSGYDLAILDYNGDRWPEETDKAFLNFVKNGGGVVVYHAADNAFREWEEFNKIIGFGGWNGRNETDGPYIYMKKGKVVYDPSAGNAGSHGPQHEFVNQLGNKNHPITNGLPAKWRHAQDELYDRMRGPGKVKDALYWAHSSKEKNGSGRDELTLFTVDYGPARIFHTTLGHAGKTLHDNTAMQCTGFQVTLLRGAEWAATGKVTQPVPDDFPTETTISLRKNYK